MNPGGIFGVFMMFDYSYWYFDLSAYVGENTQL